MKERKNICNQFILKHSKEIIPQNNGKIEFKNKIVTKNYKYIILNKELINDFFQL
jgi:hypothetical protein